MTLVQKSLGAMLQGVSQQPDRIKLNGQVREQINLLSDVEEGLTSRPATSYIGLLSGATADMQFHSVQFNGVKYIIGNATGVLRIWDTNCVQYPIDYQDLYAQNYIGKDMRYHVFEQEIFALNRDTIVRRNTEVEGWPFHTAIVTALGGAYSRDYSTTITFIDGTIKTGTYTTPDGTNDGDAELTTSEHIIEQLRLSLETAGLPTGYTMSRADDVLCIRGPESMRITVADGEAGQILRCMSDTVEDRADLPRYAPEGTIVRVTGDAASEDDYFLRFNAKFIANVGNGFGKQGTWEEYFDASQPNALNLYTMPHVLTKDGSTFKLRRGEWQPRRTGNAELNPMPAFVNYAIRDVASLDSRLVFSARNCAVASRTNFPKDFFRKSVTVLVDSDPVSLKASNEDSLTLDWIIPFDTRLLLVSDPGDNQYIIPSGITPNNPSMSLTTSYEINGKTRPINAGRTVIFPFTNGKYAGLKEFFTDENVSSNGADTITPVQNKYIPGKVRYLTSSKNFNTLLVNSDSYELANTIWCYRYLWEGTERKQSAWSKWEFYQKPVWEFFDNSKVYLVFRASNGNHYLEVMDLNRIDDGVGFHVCLDSKITKSVVAGKVTLAYPDASFVQASGSYSGYEAHSLSMTELETGQFEYTMDLPDGISVICGRRFTRELQPMMPRVQDQQNQTISSLVINVSKFILHLQNTGCFEVVQKSPYREDLIQTFWDFPMDQDPLDPTGIQLFTGKQEFTWGERADYSGLAVKSDCVRPTTILEIEWEGQVTGAKRRV